MIIAFVGLTGLLTVGCLALMLTVTAMQRKTRAQAICLHLNAKMADELGKSLQRLIALNPRARRLRRARRWAERIVRVANLTKTPAVMATARAGLLAVKGLQALLAVEQQAIRADADLTRWQYQRRLGRAAGQPELQGRRARVRFGQMRALAVEARPPREIAPEYYPARDFARRQAATMSMVVRLTPDLGDLRDGFDAGARPLFPKIEQTTACVVTLRKEGRRWRPKIVAANAPSSWPFARRR